MWLWVLVEGWVCDWCAHLRCSMDKPLVLSLGTQGLLQQCGVEVAF